MPSSLSTSSEWQASAQAPCTSGSGSVANAPRRRGYRWMELGGFLVAAAGEDARLRVIAEMGSGNRQRQHRGGNAVAIEERDRRFGSPFRRADRGTQPRDRLTVGRGHGMTMNINAAGIACHGCLACPLTPRIHHARDSLDHAKTQSSCKQSISCGRSDTLLERRRSPHDGDRACGPRRCLLDAGNYDGLCRRPTLTQINCRTVPRAPERRHRRTGWGFDQPRAETKRRVDERPACACENSGCAAQSPRVAWR